MSDFVARHGLLTEAQQDAAQQVVARIEKLGVVRFGRGRGGTRATLRRHLHRDNAAA